MSQAKAPEPVTVRREPGGSAAPHPSPAHEPLCLRVFGEGVFEAFPLPASGAVVIGRASQCEVRIDEPSISRQHARLYVGTTLVIEDLGSVNGTRVGGRPLQKDERALVSVGEVIDLGSVMALVQPGTPQARPRRVWPHGYFEARVEDECTRAEMAGARFAVARIRVLNERDGEAAEILGSAARPLDVLARYGPADYEVLLSDASPEQAHARLADLSSGLTQAGHTSIVGIALFPKDGRAAEVLIARAAQAVRGDGDKNTRGVVITDGAMQKLHQLIERVAASTISVLLLGETGVGKEVLAETVHRRSPRASKPFLKLNCGAFTENLLESELFGHEKGAFTGAESAKPGLLETAEGGTVFLDEVGELPLDLQVKLLRVLEERQVRRVGGLKSKPIDVRFVSATNRDLESEIGQGRVRRDLFYRLNGISLMIPPLRQRVGEIENLARAFIADAARAMGRAAEPALSAGVLEQLQRYSWPGNIRELRNTMERAVLLCDGDTLLPEHLPLDKMQMQVTRPASKTMPALALRPAPLKAQPPPEGEVTSTTDGANLRDEVRMLEKKRILAALEQCAGNQSRAAKLLGISRSALVVRLEMYGVKRPRKS